VGFNANSALDYLFVKRVAHVVNNGYHYGFVHLVADNFAGPGFSQVSLFAHLAAPPS